MFLLVLVRRHLTVSTSQSMGPALMVLMGRQHTFSRFLHSALFTRVLRAGGGPVANQPNVPLAPQAALMASQRNILLSCFLMCLLQGA